MSPRPDVLDQIVRQALDLGADTLEVEYRDGREEVVAYLGAVGREIALLGSGTAEAKALRSALYECEEKPRRLRVGDQDVVIRPRRYDDFGEDAFRIKLRRSNSFLRSGRDTARTESRR